jgi:hypothetical protein
MSMTESGLRLVTPSADASIAAVRALSECACTNPLRKNRTVPFVPFTAPVAKATVAWEDLMVPRHTNNKRARRHDVKASLAAFKETQPGKFTVNDYAMFADVPVITASGQMPNYVTNGTLVRCGKAGRNILYKFA